ncbi:MAG TPA: hypothetical protein VFP58_09610 [Candidatus Eisenbacteria bacterium]|nr:hypothetical protein [Candidatus Eisenbacteria bacterium]
MNRIHGWTGLALALALWIGALAAAPVRYWNQGKRITAEPKMHVIPNTDVMYQRRAPGYDLYRYADRWFLVDDGEWFEGTTWRGPFVAAVVESLPEPVTFIPAEYRKYWEPGSATTWASSRGFAKKPEMRAVTRSGVSYAIDVGDADLYRYRSQWYLVENGQWHHSDSWKGPFLAMTYDRVPLAVQNVPAPYRNHWKRPGT